MGELHENWVETRTAQVSEIGAHILSLIGESVVSVEPTADSLYLETESGQVYAVSLIRCEE